MSQLSILLHFSMLIAMAASDYTPCVPPCYDRASPSELAKMKVRLYRNNSTDYDEVLIGDSIQLLAKMDLTKPVVMYIHGYLQCINLQLFEPTIDALLLTGLYNVMFTDWGEISCTIYTYAAKSCESIGWTIAQQFNQWVAAGLNMNVTQLIGFSLGAQISGFIGKNTNFRVGRITGLDPAGPLFNTAPAEKRLSSTDANMVDSIHTNMYKFGTFRQIGILDVYVNGGCNQPSCWVEGLDPCSHTFAMKVMTASINNPDLFWARVCDSWFAFVFGMCDSNEMIPVGYATPETARGQVYMRTTSLSPYGCGKSCATSK